MSSVQRGQRFWLLAATAALAAVVAHVCVDVAGDYLLAHDDYDNVVHHSRILALALVTGIAVVAILRVFGEMLHSTARNPRTLLYRLRGSLGNPLLFAVQAAALTVVTMAAMESLDCALSADFGGWTALFGGSVLLGGGTATGCGAILGFLAHRFLAWLADREPRIAALIVAVFRAQIAGATCITASRATSAAAPRRRELLLSCLGRKRGPPLPIPG
jgi:hypothetical protein